MHTYSLPLSCAYGSYALYTKETYYRYFVFLLGLLSRAPVVRRDWISMRALTTRYNFLTFFVLYFFWQGLVYERLHCVLPARVSMSALLALGTRLRGKARRPRCGPCMMPSSD